MKQTLLLLASFILIIHGFAQCETFHTTITSASPTCFENEDGMLSAMPLGGASPYSVDIFNADGYLLNPFGATTLNTLVEGWYYVNAEDAIGCFSNDSVFIENPVPLSLDYTTTDPTATDICDGSILIDTVYGDYDTLTYYWAPNPSGSEDSLLDDACYGTYILVVTNENECFVSYSIDLALYLSTTAIENNPTLFHFSALTSGSTTVQNNTSEKAVLLCYDLAGNLILSTNLSPGLNSINIPSHNHLILYQIYQSGELVDSGKMNN